MGKIGEMKLRDSNMMEVVVMDDGEYTFHTALYRNRPPFVFRVPRYATSASSFAIRDGIIKFDFIREAELIEVARWLERNPHHKILSTKNVAIPKQ